MEHNGQPATKADLDALEQRLEQRLEGKIDSLEQRFEGKLDASEQRTIDRVTELVRDSETKLLRAFYSFAESNDKRVGQLEGNSAVVVSRLSTLEGRVLEIEKRLNMPPAS